jgi:hypothetical protein
MSGKFVQPCDYDITGPCFIYSVRFGGRSVFVFLSAIAKGTILQFTGRGSESSVSRIEWLILAHACQNGNLPRFIFAYYVNCNREVYCRVVWRDTRQ